MCIAYVAHKYEKKLNALIHTRIVPGATLILAIVVVIN